MLIGIFLFLCFTTYIQTSRKVPQNCIIYVLDIFIYNFKNDFLFIY